MPRVRSWAAPRAKALREGRCRVCRRSDTRLDAAHIIPRSRVAPGPGEDERNIIPLCREHHAEYDLRQLDILPFLYPDEQGYAVEVAGGLLSALERITNERWAPRENE